jgi:hypothetical protein
MKLQNGVVARTRVLALVMAMLALADITTRACTIFVLTDTNRALFCNNEDWSDPKSRIWFQPGNEGYHGAVYVGFENGWAQGGLNTEGLAYDWVAGYTEKWEADPQTPFARGNSSQRMLETCATVSEAIAFYQHHSEPSFALSKILVADRTGASVIIGVRDGKLQVYPDNQCRGFGFGRLTLGLDLTNNSAATVTNGFKILRDCRQSGTYATKYSNIYDLQTGDIYLDPFPDRDDEVKINLAAELKKGGHYYDMLQIHEQLAQAPRPLPPNMKRFPMDEFKPIPDKEPEVAVHLRAIIQDIMEGTPKVDDYKSEAWKELLPDQKKTRENMKPLGELSSLVLLERSNTNGLRGYRYRVEFSKATLLMRFMLDAQNKLAAGTTESMEWKPGANLVDAPGNMVVAGIGVVLRAEGQSIIVQEIVPGSPAAVLKQIHAGDRIVAVAQEQGESVPVEGGKLAQAVDLIRGQVGTPVRLTIVPAGKDATKAYVVKLVRAKLQTAPY